MENKDNKDKITQYKIEYLKGELLDLNKCQEFSKKLCEYIRNSKNNNNKN